MAIDFGKWGMFGAIAGVATGFLLSTISKLLSMIPGLTVNLQSVTVTGNVSGAFSTGLSTYAQKLFGLVPLSLTMPEIIYTALGGAAFAILGALLVDYFGQLKGSKWRKVATVMVVASVVSTWLLSMAISIPAIAVFITLIVDSLVLGFIYVKVDEGSRLNLIP